MRSIVYLHGFASSVHSTKAVWLGTRATAAGYTFRCPDLNQPDFATLTVTRMIEQLDAEIAACPPGRIAIVGSSLGAVVALRAAARSREAWSTSERPVDALVLLAPAVDIVRSFEREFGPAAVAEWQARGSIEVFHYGDGRKRALGWSFFDDLRTHDTLHLTVPLPMLIYQGIDDEAVDSRTVVEWAARQPHAHVHLVEDGHQLTRSLETIWTGMQEFLARPS